jgi:hypothetical protein
LNCLLSRKNKGNGKKAINKLIHETSMLDTQEEALQ